MERLQPAPRFVLIYGFRPSLALRVLKPPGQPRWKGPGDLSLPRHKGNKLRGRGRCFVWLLFALRKGSCANSNQDSSGQASCLEQQHRTSKANSSPLRLASQNWHETLKLKKAM